MNRGLHWICLGPWPAALAITSDEAAYNRWVKRNSTPSACAFPKACGWTQKFARDDGTMVIMIAIAPKMRREGIIISLAHEATHAMRWILDHAEEKTPGIEAEAYLVEHIVREGMKRLLKR